MKKIVIASLIALSAAAASAAEIGVISSRNYADEPNRNSGGVTLTGREGAVSLSAGFERFSKGANDQDRYSLVTGYDIAKVGRFTVTPKVGLVYLDNQVGENGYAATVGAGVSTELTKKVILGLDVARQYGQTRVQTSDGNLVSLSLRYRF